MNMMSEVVRLRWAMCVLSLACVFPVHAEPGVTDTAIAVGQSAVFSGPVAATGNNYRRGIELYFEQANKAGGVLTRENFIAALEGVGNLDLGGVRVEYGPGNHNGSSFVELEMYTAEGNLIR